MSKSKPLLILIAGPYRSGTGNNPKLIEKNLERLESYSLPIYKKGHIPLIGEWVALPIVRQAGSKSLGDAVSEQFLYPVADRLLERCDAVLRIAGESKSAPSVQPLRGLIACAWCFVRASAASRTYDVLRLSINTLISKDVYDAH